MKPTDNPDVVTVRDFAAMLAMAGQLANQAINVDPQEMGVWSYKFADALIAESQKDTHDDH